MNADTPERSSTNKTILIVVGIVAAVILIIFLGCFGLIYFVFTKFVSPAMSSAMQMVNDLQQATAAGTEFVGDIQADRLDAAYQLTTKNFQQKMSLEEFRKLIEKNPTLRKHTATNFQPNFTPPRMILHVTLSGPDGQLS